MIRKTSSSTAQPFTFFPKSVFFGCLFLLLFSASSAQGDLLVTPKRVVLEGGRQSENLNLANIGKDSATYVISFIQIRMHKDGTFEKIEMPDSAQLFAEPYLRVFPRTVTLAPNESQTVKLQLRRNSEMKEGEYRSHLYFRAVPRENPLGEKNTGIDTAIAVRLVPIFGISIPVIVRKGEANTQVALSEVALVKDQEKGPTAKLTFGRSGNMSVYGDITVTHISAAGKETKVGTAKGFAVYTPNTSRYFYLTLENNTNIDYSSGKLQVVYTDASSSKPVVLAQKELVLQ